MTPLPLLPPPLHLPRCLFWELDEDEDSLLQVRDRGLLTISASFT